LQNLEIEFLNPNLNLIMKILAIKPGPKPKTEEGDLDKRRRVSPPNIPKYNPPLKPHKPKK
jgi:hypothetical protein